MPDPMAGMLLGERYQLIQPLGLGRTARTYIARQVDTDQRVALKVLVPELCADEDLRERFREEVRLAVRVTHRNVATVLDFRVSRTEAWLATEYVPGPTLAAVSFAEGQLPPRRTARLVGDLLAALEQVHAVGVVHGDVKCANVIVSRTDEDADRAKLVDFGAARSFRPPSHMRAAMNSGTPGYIAPEVIAGEPPTPVADLYGVGIVLYELVCGRPPFTGRTPLETLWRQVHEEAVLPSLHAGRRVSRRLDAVILRAVAKRPSERWQSPASLAAALADAMNLDDDPAVGAPAAFEPVAPEMPSAPPVGEPAQQDEALRTAIGEAVRIGDPDEVVRLYELLALELSRGGNPRSAAAELREAIDILSLENGDGNNRAIRSLQLLLDSLMRSDRPRDSST